MLRNIPKAWGNLRHFINEWLLGFCKLREIIKKVGKGKYPRRLGREAVKRTSMSLSCQETIEREKKCLRQSNCV
jgi:hypothetical protein